MVNHGVSRACLTCKSRRIKCDLTKPSCSRCSRAGRICPGFPDELDLIFRVRVPAGPAKDPSQETPSSGSNSATPPSPSESLPNISPDETQALDAFFKDYVITSGDVSLSRGYYNGLEQLLCRNTMNSDVGYATRSVALARLGNMTKGQGLLHRASTMYAHVLESFQNTLRDPRRRNSDEAVMTATLLGLYEVMTAAEAHPRAHSAHAQGVSAILCTRDLPLDILAGQYGLFQTKNELLMSKSAAGVHVTGVLTSISQMPWDLPTQSLDTLLIELAPILRASSKGSSGDQSSIVELRRACQDAMKLKAELALWPSSQPERWQPQTVGTVPWRPVETSDDTGGQPVWPGNIDIYADLYVAAVWDTYRKARLKLLTAIHAMTEHLRCDGESLPADMPDLPQLREEAQAIADALCASIPYQIYADAPEVFMSKAVSYTDLRRGKAAGGLLLMYPLYIASTIPLTSQEQRRWMKGRLRWIGEHMGISQATLLADCDEAPHGAIADGHTILWAGSLSQPVPSLSNTPQQITERAG